ncbi:MAG TPA: ATP phosphoribosyltransferase regulatory subunit [Pyrinomonadaceae bacterium]|jgi:ATP phosphoribosyltransferase regulatory subunit|nr:ATP phosphoribosyltransferase regulatory subunit [Pyrinomonadaceae bacterium]
MTEPLSNIPGGMRYYFGREARLRRAVEDAVMSVFDGWGYEEISAPSVDFYALFERGMGHEEARRSFRFTDTDGRLLALRPDVTSSVARAAATLFASAERPLRFCYAASVFRQRPRSHAEWKRQGRQLGCELIGAGGEEADLEVLVIAAEVLERLGLDYRITVNHAGVFNGLAARLSLGQTEREEARRLVDTRDSSGLQSFLAGSRATEAPLARQLARLSGKRDVLDEALALASGEDGTIAEALRALERTWDVIETVELSESFEVDLGDVSGLDYYTGLVFKIYVAGAGARVGGGGRYDELTANFGRREPAIGFVLDLDAVSEVLLRGGEFGARGASESEAKGVAGVDARERLGEARRMRARGERIRLG